MTHFNLNRMLQGCSAFIQTMAGNRAARNDAKRVNNHVLPLTCPLLASSLRLTRPLRPRRIALIFAVLVMSIANIGMAWGTNQTYTIDKPSADVNASGPIQIFGEKASKTVGGSSINTYSLQNTSVYVMSYAENIKSITLEVCWNGSASGTKKAVKVYGLRGKTFSTSASNVSATLGGSAADMSDVVINATNSTTQTLVVTCSTPISCVYFAAGKDGYAVVKSVSVVYDDAITYPSLYSEGHFTSTTTGSATNSCSWSAVDLNSTTAVLSDKSYYKGNSANTFALATGETLAAGDVIVLDITGAASGDKGAPQSKSISMTLTNGPTWAFKTVANTAYDLIYVIPTGSSLIGASSFSFDADNTNTRMYGARVYHTAAASCSDETGLAYGTGTVTKTYGDAVFTNTLTNPNSLGVTYSSTNTNVATVNSSTGAVTIKAAGTTTITATWAGNATYCADAVSYTLNVKPAVGSVSGAWDRFGGETISLSVTPSGGSSYTYQWQKWYNDQWNNVSNGTVSGSTTSGATTNNLRISNCSKDHSGSYRCQVTAGGQTNETDGLQVKVFTLECYNGGTTVYNFTRTGESQAGTVEINLAASTAYQFKFHVDNTYYGNNASINEDITNYVFCNSDNGGDCAVNFTVNSGLGGTFTFSMDYSTGGNSSVLGEPELSVTYPRKTIYLTPGVWNSAGAKFAIYYFRKVGETTYGNGWTDFLTANDCGMSAEIPQWNGVKVNAVRLKNTCTSPNWDDKWNQTSDITISSNNSVVITDWGSGDSPYTYGTYATPTYTISYNAGTGGSGSKASESKTCGVDFTLPNSAVFTRTGYTQVGWTTTDGGAQEYALGGTYTTNEDKTFYPVWEAAASLTALVANTLYEVPDMIPSGASLTSSDQFLAGLSANTKFELIGSASGSTTPKVNNKSDNDKTIDDITFDDGSMWFKGNASLTSNIPTTFGLSFIVPEGGGKLYLYFSGETTNIKLAKSGSEGSKPTLTDGYAAVDVTAGTYYLYGTGTDAPYCFYGLKLVVCTTPATAFGNGAYTVGGSALDLSTLISGKQGSGAITYTVKNANGTGATIAGSNFTATSAGTATVTATQAADATYCEKVMDATITVSAAGGCPTEITGGTVYKLQIKTGLTNGNLASTGTTTLTTANYLSEAITNGSASVTSPSAGNAKIADNKAINLNDGAAYITLNLDCPIQEHDIIKYTITQQNGGLYKATSRSDGNLLLQLPKTSNSSTIGQIEVTSGSKLIGKTTLYLFAKSNGAYNYYFEIIRPLKITLDATTNGGTAVDPIYGATDDKVVLQHAFKSGSRFNGWYTAASGGTKQADYYTITTGTTLFAQFTAGCAVTGTMFSLSFPSSLYPASNTAVPANSSMNLLQYATITGGAAIAENTNSSAKGSMQTNGKFVLDDAKVCVHITLDCPLQLNDVISTTIETQNLSYTATSTRSTTNYFTKGTNQTTTITADHVLLNSRDIYIWTHSSSGGKLISINISRPVGTKYSVTYDGNDKTSGSVPTDDNEYDPADEVTTAAQGSLAKTNYTFGGWNTKNDGTGTNTAAGSTFTITDNTTLYAKWTQAVTLNANTSNHGSGDNGAATAVWNAKALTGITHTTPASGYKLLGYYTTASGDGVKVLNSDGTFAGSNVTDYITSGKWSRTDEAPTLYARYESSGALIWNLGVNTDATSLTTSSKNSEFAQIAGSNMTNAALTGISYSQSKKSELTGVIETPTSYDGAKYVSVTFQVAAGYKFTPSSVNVKVQPKDNAKTVKIELFDASSHSQNYTSDSQSAGLIHTVTMTGNGTFYTGTVTLKIYCYGASGGYRLGTPISIEGEVEATCTMPSFDGLNYEETSYSLGDDASAITVTNPANVTTYAWKQNTTNDRSGTTPAAGTNNEQSYTPTTSSEGTMYYWCELISDCGTVKTPAVGITVSVSKSDATISWTGTSASANYGGGGYTVKATVNETGWNGKAADLTLSAPAGIRIYNIVSGETASMKWVQASFDVTTTFDRETYSTTIPFVVTADATATYNAISDEHAVSYEACTGAGVGESYNIRMKVVTKDGNYYHCANTDGWISANINSSHSTTNASTTMATVFDTVASSNTQYVWVRTYHADINKVRIYADFRADNMTVANVYKSTNYFSADSKYAVDYTAIYNGDEGYDDLGDAAQGYVDIELDNVLEANDVLLVAFNTNKVRPLGAVITEGSAGSLNTHLQWSGSLADGATENKKTTDAYFTYSASMITENTNSLGAITYSSSDPSVATVDATGKVAMVAAGTTTIKATLAASGCYKKAEIRYTLNVTEEECAIAAGTLALTSGAESKCSSNNVTLTLTGFESGATLQWKDGDTDINNGGNYTIVTDGTTSTLTTNQPGTYSVIVTKGCFVRSNRITITNKSTSVHVTRLVKEWYIKNGRLTPDIALWELGDDCSFVGVTASSGWDDNTGLTAASSFYAKDGIVYLKGTEPNPNAGTVQNYTLTLTVNDGCGNQTLDAEGKEITIHHQQNTDKHVLAFVVNGTDKGDWTAGVTADQTTNVGLYNAIAANFDVFATNIYSTDDGQKIKEYYSQFDIICITDYPNSNTKGVNKRKYVDAMGELIDIRPILTMEAFVSDKPTWAAKGISGNPKDPTTRQYTMDLQCKDHEIFAGTDLTKVGEGDEAMFRVSMVDNTKADYATLDATYGSGTHEKSTGYKYHDCPALQGFTFTQAMSDNDLLPIGLIEDGAGNPLQVGIERQAVMEARLMVLGINSYAMERLTDDGERVVLNTLNYLMKKNAEDIADCSTAFVGGAEGDTKNWHNVANWTGNTLPTKTQRVRIMAECELNASAHVAGVTIVNGGKYNHGNDDANGKLTIMPNGALVVTGKVQEAKAPAYNKPYATSPEHLIINTSETAQAALIFNNDEASTKATVNYYSLGRKIESAYQFQYFAIPFEYLSVSPTFANVTHNTTIYTFVWHEASGWERRGYYSDLYAFEGVGITTASTSPINYQMKGTLASTAEREITLTKDNDGENIIGNSWMAPIDIASLKNAIGDDSNVEKVVYIYITGNDNGTGSSSSSETAGKWLAIPIDASGWRDWTGQKVIPAMQAYYIKANAETTLTLNYDEVVRNTAVEQLNVPLKAPRRTMNNDGISLLTLRLENSKEHTDLYLFEGERFSDGYDNGWEAKQMADEGVMQFYAMNGEDKMAVLATDELEGTPVCFTPGNESNYTISFFGGDGRYYLNDLKEEQSTAIEQGNTYSFTYEQGDMPRRFLISTTPFGIPSVTTGIGGVEAQEKVQKIMYKDHIYIIRAGRVYDIVGKEVR